MNATSDPYANAMLMLHKKVTEDIAMLRGAFARDAIISGRHSHASLADLLQEAAQEFESYKGSPTEIFVELLRKGQLPSPCLTVIDGGKSD